ncbi:MAG: trimethylamine methyltransferase family protein [Desulfobacterales bacterium]|nr:trimethylamine methyltransferase family protein [Desulfobacterales bacterium]
MPGITPISYPPGMRVSIFSDKDLHKIHQATLSILKDVGIKFPCKKALKAFKDHGAEVDFTSQIVKIPEDLLKKCLDSAPKNFVMGSRGSKSLDIVLDRKSTYMGTDGSGCATIDLDTQQKRSSSKKDVADMAKISDFLSTISFYWPIVSATDVPAEVISLHELDAAFNNTEKHVHTISCVHEAQAQYAVKMAEIISGGKENMRKRPPLSQLACPISPLTHDEDALNASLHFAAAGLPVGFGVMPTLGSTSPASISGLYAMGNAEILSGLCYIQINYPGAPIFYPFFSMVMNPYTGGGLSGTAIQHLMYAGVVELGHYYDLPVMSYAGGGDARQASSWQAGRDTAMDHFLLASIGADMLASLGLVQSNTLLYPEGLLLDNDIVQSIIAMTKGIEVDDLPLAIEEIKAVGPGGHFLDRMHTIKSTRKNWNPGISYQWSAENNEFKDPREAAMERTRWILENYKPNPIDEKIQVVLKKLIHAAEKELIKP